MVPLMKENAITFNFHRLSVTLFCPCVQEINAVTAVRQSRGAEGTICSFVLSLQWLQQHSNQ